MGYKITTQKEEGYTIVKLEGDILHANGGADAVTAAMKEAASGEKPQVLLDLGAANKIDSASFRRFFVDGFKAIGNNGGNLKTYVVANERPKKLIDITKLGPVLGASTDREEIVRQLAPQRAAIVRSGVVEIALKAT